MLLMTTMIMMDLDDGEDCRNGTNTVGFFPQISSRVVLFATRFVGVGARNQTGFYLSL